MRRFAAYRDGERGILILAALPGEGRRAGAVEFAC